MAVHVEPEQLWLPRFEAASKPTDRLFFAIFPDHVAAQHIAQVARRLHNKYRLQSEPLQTKRFHVSLCHLGDYFDLPQDVVARAKEAASSVTVQSFELGFDRAANFSGRHVDPESRRTHPHVLHANEGVAEITALQRALASAIAQAGLSPRVRMNYTPHLTLLYGERRMPEDFIETIRWSVREFVLVHSLLGKTQHVLLGRWPLSGRYPVRSASSPREKTIFVAG
jgi:2'-5' RNA ligase